MKILIIFQFICVYWLCVSAYSVRIRTDNTKAIRMDDSKAIRMDDKRSARSDDSKAIRMDDQKAIRMDNPKAIRMDNPKAFRMDDAAFVRMADSNSTSSSGNATAVPVPKTTSAAPAEESGNILDKIKAVQREMRKKLYSVKKDTSDIKYILHGIESALIAALAKGWGRWDDSKKFRMDNTKAIRMDDVAFVRMADSNSTSSSGNVTAVPMPKTTSAAPAEESGNILDKIKAVQREMRKSLFSVKKDTSDIKYILDGMQSVLIAAKPTCPPIEKSDHVRRSRTPIANSDHLRRSRTPTADHVRLIDGLGYSGKVGRLEVLVDGKWGTVEDDEYNGSNDQNNNNVAKVVCHQLGYGRSGRIFVDSEYDETSKKTPRLIASFGCTGNENKIGECKIERQPAGSEESYVDSLGVGCD